MNAKSLCNLKIYACSSANLFIVFLCLAFYIFEGGFLWLAMAVIFSAISFVYIIEIFSNRKNSSGTEKKKELVKGVLHNSYIENEYLDIQDVGISRPGEVKMLRRIFDSWTGDRSLVLGIEGDWGAGKSTVLNYSIRSISESNVVIRLSPWASSSSHDFMYRIIDESTSKVSSSVGGFKGFRLRFMLIFLFLRTIDYPRSFRIAEYQNIVLVIGAVLGAFILSLSGLGGGENENNGGVGLIILILFLLFSRHLVSIFCLSKESFFDLYKVSLDRHAILIGEYFSRCGYRPVFIFDDIDRLSERDLYSVIKVVRALSSMPSSILALVYDREEVNSKMKSISCSDVSGFFDKLISKVVHIPSLSGSESAKLLLAKVSSIKGFYDGLIKYKESERVLDRERFQVLVEGLSMLLDTPRKVEKTSSEVTDFVVSHKEAIPFDPIDVMVASVIRHYYIELFRWMSENHSYLSKDSEYNESLRKGLCDVVIDCGISYEVASFVVCILYPAAKKSLKATSIPDLRLNESVYHVRHRVCAMSDPSSFYRLYKPDGEDNDAARSVLGKVLSRDIDGAIYSTLRLNDRKSLINHFRHMREAEELTFSVEMLEYLARIGLHLTDLTDEMFSLSEYDECLILFCSLMSSAGEGVSSVSTLHDLVVDRNIRSTIFLDFIRSEKSSQGRASAMSSAAISRVVPFCAQAVLRFFMESDLYVLRRHGLRALFGLNELSPADFQQAVTQCGSSPLIMVSVFLSSRRVSWSHESGRMHAQREETYNYKWLEEYFDLDSLLHNNFFIASASQKGYEYFLDQFFQGYKEYKSSKSA